MTRIDGRRANEHRPLHFELGVVKHAAGSVLISLGDTKVICTASVEERVPPFLKDAGKGWITAEYAMLPASTHTRNSREVNKGKPSGRTNEIQRLIGRALRSVVDLNALGERSIYVDCDVLQADGGTRTASITGGMIALQQAVNGLLKQGLIKQNPVRELLAALSVGIVADQVLLDLCYAEDSQAAVDMNVVMTESGQFVELQGTGESSTFSKSELTQMLGVAEEGLNAVFLSMRTCLKSL